MKLSTEGQEVCTPADIVKDPLGLEFLGLPESPKLLESTIEANLINNLQNFLLELGNRVRHEVVLKSCFRMFAGNHPCHWMNLGI